MAGAPDRFSRKPAVILALIGLAALSIASWVLVRIPGVPYNVRELFPPGHADVSAVLFAALLLFGGFAPAWVAGLFLKNPRWSLGTPVWAAMVALVAWVLLRLSVTTESIDDILGSPVLRWGWDWEYICRFLAQYGGSAIILIAASAAVGTASRSGTYAGIQTGLGLLFTNLPLLLLVHFVVIEWACTDNLTELIRDDPYPGDAFLMVLVLLLGLNASVVAHTWRSPRAGSCLLALVATPILAFLGWLLLDAALVPQLTKYGITFPAVRFLLGPERQTNLPKAAFLLRWTLVYVAAVFTLAYGQLVALMLQPFRRAVVAAGQRPLLAGAAEPRGVSRVCPYKVSGRGYRLLLLFYAAFLIYGSLVPLEFRSRTLGDAWADFLSRWPSTLIHFSRTDFAANVLIGVPLGFFGMGVLTRENMHRARWLAAVGLMIGGGLLSAGVEFSQLFCLVRTTAFSDILAQCIGNAIGIAVWFLAGSVVTCWGHSLWQEHVQGRRAVKILAGYAVGLFLYQLLPMDIIIRPEEIYHRLKNGQIHFVPFADLHGLDLYAILSTVAMMMPIGYLLALLFSATRRRPWLVVGYGVLFATGIEFLQIFIASRFASATDVVLGTVGVAAGAWAGRHFGPEARPGLTETAFWTRHGWWIKATALSAWLGACVWYKWRPFGFEWPPGGLGAHLQHAIRAPLTYLYHQTEVSAAATVAREFIVFVVIGMLLKSLAGELAGRRLAIALAASVTAAIAIGLEAGQLFLHSRGADMASVLIPIVSGIGGAFLYDPFVTTFIKGSRPSSTGSGDWQGT